MKTAKAPAKKTRQTQREEAAREATRLRLAEKVARLPPPQAAEPFDPGEYDAAIGALGFDTSGLFDGWGPDLDANTLKMPSLDTRHFKRPKFEIPATSLPGGRRRGIGGAQ